MSANIAEQVTVREGATHALMFVINLCASTSPMALTPPSTPELKRFTFFVTRQREDGRERFRLHMGYFPSQEAAEALLASVRDIYPAAWAGPAPSSAITPRRLRPDAVAPAFAPAAAAAPAVAAAPTPTHVPARPAAPPAARAVPPPAAPARVPAPAPAASAPVARKGSGEPVLDAMSNVRDVLALLGDTTPKAIAPPVVTAPPMAVPPRAAQSQAPRPQAPTLQSPPAAAKTPPAVAKAPASVARPPAPAAKAASPAAPVAATTAPAPAPKAAAAPASAPAMTALQPDKPFRPFGDEVEDGQVRVVTPEDTQTLTDIRLDRQTNAPPCFAVQLIWSVTPIDVTKQAHLAIFDAYTLYNVEGNRQGRRWYGLRLGFFSDPNSATQVAYYVRSDYPKVAVVPVATRERECANVGSSPSAKARLGEPSQALKPETQIAFEKQALDGFELLKDDRPTPPKRDVDDGPAATKARAAVAAAIAKAGPAEAEDRRHARQGYRQACRSASATGNRQENLCSRGSNATGIDAGNPRRLDADAGRESRDHQRLRHSRAGKETRQQCHRSVCAPAGQAQQRLSCDGRRLQLLPNSFSSSDLAASAAALLPPLNAPAIGL